MTRFKTSIAATMAALTLGATFAATSAEAGPKKYGPYKYGYGYHHHHKGWGYGAVGAGVLGAVAVGALASNAYAASGCYIQEQERIDRWGNIYVRPVKVCY